MSEFPDAPSVAPGASAREKFIEHKKYPPVGVCIYCGSSGGTTGLSSEHIVPFSLGGNAEILEASCVDCAKITSQLERHLARNIFWELRIHTNTQTRRPKDRPTVLPARVSIGKRHDTLMLTIQDHPSFLVMPVWGLPGLLRGARPTDIFPETKAHLYYYIPPNIRETLKLDDGQLAELHPPEISIDPSVFARAIAKIAYCQMVAVYGLTGFRPLVLPDLILGKYPCVAYFVGCELANPPPPHERKFVHGLNISEMTIDRLKFLLVSVRLFANSGTPEHGTPIYRVVAGAPGFLQHWKAIVVEARGIRPGLARNDQYPKSGPVPGGIRFTTTTRLPDPRG